MANTITDLNNRIEKIEKLLKGFGDFKPGEPARLEYIKKNIGDAEAYLGEELLMLRSIRRDLKIFPNDAYLNRSPRKERFMNDKAKNRSKVK